MALEGKEPLFEVGQRGEVVGREDLSLDDREVDFDLVEPTGMERRVDEDRIGPLGAESVDRFLATMSGAVVHDPEDASRGLVGLLAHDFANKAIHRRNAILELATTEDLGTVDIPGSQVETQAPPRKYSFHSRGTVRRSRQSRLFPAAGLNAGLFVGRDNKVVIPASRRWWIPNRAMLENDDRKQWRSHDANLVR